MGIGSDYLRSRRRSSTRQAYEQRMARQERKKQIRKLQEERKQERIKEIKRQEAAREAQRNFQYANALGGSIFQINTNNSEGQAYNVLQGVQQRVAAQAQAKLQGLKV